MEGSRIARTRETRPDTGEILRCGGLPAKSAGTWVKALPRVNNGLGVAILSTPKGVMADHDARDNNVGGEILCTVF